MAKVINVIDMEEKDNGKDLYQIKSLKNNIRFKINEVINEDDIRDLINTGYEVNIKERKQEKD